MSTFWNKVETVATGLGVKGGTMRQWKYRGYVPFKWHYPLSENAKKFSTEITIQELRKHSSGDQIQ